MKNNMYNGTIQAIVKGSMASMAIAGLVAISSCKKGNEASVAVGIATVSSTPPTHNKPYTFTSNVNKRVGILVEDANGNIIPLEEKMKQKGSPTLGNCADPDAVSASHFVYCGWSAYDICFNPYAPVENLYFSWYLYLPEDVNIINDATCIAKGKIGPYGFNSAPTGTGYRTMPYTYTLIGTEVEPISGETMKKWRIVTQETPFTQADYCGNQTLLATVKVKTDCSDLGTYLQPSMITDSMSINSLSVPELYTYGHSSPKRIEFVPNILSCGNGCHGYWKWCTNYKVQYRLVGSSVWSPEFSSPQSTSVASFFVPITNNVADTYQVRYKGLIRGTLNTAGAVWSDWKTPSTTVVVP